MNGLLIILILFAIARAVQTQVISLQTLQGSNFKFFSIKKLLLNNFVHGFEYATLNKSSEKSFGLNGDFSTNF